MKFNSFIREQIYHTLQKYDFKIIDISERSVKFQSFTTELNIAYNECDSTLLVEIGKLGEFLYPLNDEAIRKICNSSLPIEQVSLEVFSQNLSKFFQTKGGIKLLKGELNLLVDIVELQSENYTSKLIQEQVLEKALVCWKTNDYKGFMEYIDEIGINNVPKSYQLRYQIAKRN